MSNPVDTNAKAATMSNEERLIWMRNAMNELKLSWADLAKYTGYSHSAVGSWFTATESTRHRAVPARAIDRLQLEIKAGNVYGSK